MLPTPYKIEEQTFITCPLVVPPVTAGFPSPADDYIDDVIDLNDHLIKHPSATFFVRARGESMINAGIRDGNILIVDKSLEAKDGDIIIALLDGEFTVKRLKKFSTHISLIAEHPDFKPIVINEDSNFEVWGVVTWILNSPISRK